MCASTFSRKVVFVLMDAFLMTPLANASGFNDSGTLTEDSVYSCHIGALDFTRQSGFSSGAFGAYSPLGVTGGESINGIYDVSSSGPICTGSHAVLVVTGFSSNPGNLWLTSITCNAVTLTSRCREIRHGI